MGANSFIFSWAIEVLFPFITRRLSENNLSRNSRILVLSILAVSTAAFLCYIYGRVYFEMSDTDRSLTAEPLLQIFYTLDEYRMEPYERIGKRLQSWRKNLEDLNQAGLFNVDEFERIDFSLPEDAAYGDDPNNEFFNPGGTFKALPIPQRLLNDVSEGEQGNIFFNIRRGVEKGNADSLPADLEVDTLFAIIPNLKLRKCNNINVIGKGDPEAGIPFKIERDNHIVVSDGFHFKGCTYTHDRKHVYLFFPIFERYRGIGHDEWKSFQVNHLKRKGQ